jgi:hypothetical protein
MYYSHSLCGFWIIVYYTATSGQIPEIPSSSSSSSSTQRHSSTSSEPPPQQRGSLTGEYSEEGSADTDSISSLDRTGHTLAIGEETGQKERVIVHGIILSYVPYYYVLYTMFPMHRVSGKHQGRKTLQVSQLESQCEGFL